jgi:hypothetical protein
MAKINPGKYAIYIASVLLLVTMTFVGVFNRLDVLVLTAGVGLVSHGSGLPLPMTLLLASLATFLGTVLPFGVSSYATIQGFEGFASEEKDEEFEDEDFEEEDFEEEEKGEGFKVEDDEEFENDEEFEEEDFEEEEGFADAGAEKKKKRKRRPAPDNRNNKEMFELGKKYKLPAETDDNDFHLDAGTTFMNAYKSLKPDQISAMTKDTQELINTQKQLMSTLNTLKPLISDGKQMMDTFQGYFGADGVGGLGKMAENFGK